MMPDAVVLLASLAGFLLLALVTERQAKQLLRRVPSSGWRWLCRVLGGLLLAVALELCMKALGTGIGLAQWFGWMCVAALALVFVLPKWPGQPPAPAVPARKARGGGERGTEEDEAGEAATPHRSVRRWLGVVLLAGVVLGYGVALRGVLV